MVDSDDQGRMIPAALADRLAEGVGPAIVCLQAGEVHTGAFDPFEQLVEIARTHAAWVLSTARSDYGPRRVTPPATWSPGSPTPTPGPLTRTRP